MKILAGIDTDFEGSVEIMPTTSRRINEKGYIDTIEGEKSTVGYLSQEPEFDPKKDVMGNILTGLPPHLSDLFYKYHKLKIPVKSKNFTEKEFSEFKKFEEKLLSDGINVDLYRMIERALDALQCPHPLKPIGLVFNFIFHFFNFFNFFYLIFLIKKKKKTENLSGGEKRRIALCRLLVSQPDILLLVKKK